MSILSLDRVSGLARFVVTTRIAAFVVVLVAWLLAFLMLFAPSAFKPLKVVLIALLLGAIVLGAIATRRLALHRTIVWWTLAYALAGALFVAIGLSQDAPGALQIAPLYIIWPIAYAILIAGGASRATLGRVRPLSMIATFAICAYTVTLFLVAAGILPSILLIGLPVEALVSFYPGQTLIYLASLPTLIFLLPYLLALVAVDPDTRSWRRKWPLWLAVLMALAVVLFSARRGIIVSLALSPFVFVALSLFLPGDMGAVFRRRLLRLTGSLVAIVIGTALVAHFAFGWGADRFLTFFQAGFKLAVDSGELSAQVRAIQFNDLMAAWAAHPILGNGAGATVATFVRDPDMTWAYELSYVSLLFQTGAVGFGLYAAGVMWIFWMGARIIRSGDPLGTDLLPILTGTAAFLVANATNPYLAKWDFLWVLFLPIAYVNVWLLEGSQATRVASVVRPDEHALAPGAQRVDREMTVQ